VGFIGQILSFTRTVARGAKVSNVKTNPGGGANVTTPHFADPGDDSFPLETDYVAAVDVRQTGRSVAVGYVDPNSDQKAAKGEKRIYARDSNGTSIVEVHLKADGEANINNANGSVVLFADGRIVLTSPGGSVAVEVDGSVVSSNSAGDVTLRADGGVELDSPLALVEAKADGEIKGSNAGGLFTLDASGNFSSSNASGSFALKSNGDFEVNGVIISAAGTLTIPAGQKVDSPFITVDGKELKDHTHSGVDAGIQNTGPNN